MNTETKPAERNADDRCRQHGCRRADCRDTYRTVRKRADLRRLKGVPGHTSGPRIAAHLRAVLASGKTRLEIAAESGVSERGIRYILGGQPEVQLAKARALLAVRLLGAPPRVDATGTRRRMQALATLGWQITHIADDVPISRRYGFEIVSGEAPFVDREVAERIAVLYRAKCGSPGPSRFSRNAAARKGWHGPLAWEDIDNPAAEPDTSGVGTDGPRRRDGLRNDEIKHLAGFQLPLHEIAKRVNLDEQDVKDRLAKWQSEREARQQVAA